MPDRKLSTEPYKGTRDFYPEDMAVRKYIFAAMRRAVEKYGYAEYDASILEDTALYRAKTGEEIVNEQTYSFVDRGGREVTIRPEMTPTVARMVARRRRELNFPLRWYSIPNLFRYERPQRGRLREHWQLNVDIFGVDSVEADAEIIAVAHEIMTELKAKKSDYEIRVNDRRLMNVLLKDMLHLGAEDSRLVSKLIDRRSKMGTEEFDKEAHALLGGKGDKKILDMFLDARRLEDLPMPLADHQGASDLRTLFASLKAQGVTNVVFRPDVTRGFDYYTRTVFEIFDTSPENNRSLFGGGRYDDLVGLFGVEQVGGIGFGMGDVTIRDFLETHGLLPALRYSTADIYVCRLEEQYAPDADKLAAYLRGNSVNVVVDMTSRKVPAMLKSALRDRVPFFVCVGEEEAKSGTFRVKDLEKNKEHELAREEIPALVAKGKNL